MTPPYITLTGAPIPLSALAQIASGALRLRLSQEAAARVAAGRADFMAALAGGQAIYGATTGVGALRDTAQEGGGIDAYSRALPFAHQFAVGEEVSPEATRLTLALRLNTALSGQLGVSVEFVHFLERMLAEDLLPVMNRRGSAGAADLGQMGQLATVMAGEGMVRLKGRAMGAAEALALLGITPHPMPVRDGLAAIASNSFGLAKAALHVIRAGRILRREMVLALMGAQAMGLDRQVWAAARFNGLSQEVCIAGWLLAAAEGAQWPASGRVHDPLSARMIAQVFGAAANAISEAGEAVHQETGHVDDNPVVIGGRVVTSGGSLLLSLSMRLSSVQLALGHLARNAFNRCLLMTNGQLEGLPVNLVPPGIVATGYGPVMKLALEQVVRVIDATAPVSVLNQTVAAGLEDEAAFISLTAGRLREQLDAVEWLQAVEAMLAAQALDLRGRAPAPGVVALSYEMIRHHIPPLTVDRPLSANLTALQQGLSAPDFDAALLAEAPFLPFDAILGIAPGAENPRNDNDLSAQESP
ncbi:MAG: aromatic amino acid lyase [Paracoccus sp. (in: a-proteobacteria)]|nr:aromatic amino acid lyase [Paracoccus sp. (in: a-proteobacteria)]